MKVLGNKLAPHFSQNNQIILPRWLRQLSQNIFDSYVGLFSLHTVGDCDHLKMAYDFSLLNIEILPYFKTKILSFFLKVRFSFILKVRFCYCCFFFESEILFFSKVRFCLISKIKFCFISKLRFYLIWKFRFCFFLN